MRLDRAGGTQRLSRLVGTSCAKDLIFSSKVMSALEAERAGASSFPSSMRPADLTVKDVQVLSITFRERDSRRATRLKRSSQRCCKPASPLFPSLIRLPAPKADGLGWNQVPSHSVQRKPPSTSARNSTCPLPSPLLPSRAPADWSRSRPTLPQRIRPRRRTTRVPDYPADRRPVGGSQSVRFSTLFFFLCRKGRLELTWENCVQVCGEEKTGVQRSLIERVVHFVHTGQTEAAGCDRSATVLPRSLHLQDVLSMPDSRSEGKAVYEEGEKSCVVETRVAGNRWQPGLPFLYLRHVQSP